MEERTVEVGETKLRYFVKGRSPGLLIHSGTHGDEWGVIEPVKLAVKKYQDQLPDFVFVPEVSPSAVRNRTRVNSGGVDLNRSFTDGTNESEALANMKVIATGKFDLMVSFHEDIEYETFYLYDLAGERWEEKEGWINYKKGVRELGVELLTGIDDPNDPVLGYLFKDGYGYFPKPDVESGVFGWGMKNGFISKSLEPEIPGKLSGEIKEKMVDLFFRCFLVNEGVR